MSLHHQRLPSMAGSAEPDPADPDRTSKRRLLLLHGFTQNIDCWGDFGRQLARRYDVVAVDAPGHGRSNHDDADLWETADLVAQVVRAVDEEHGPMPSPIVVGYSMGGRAALHLAIAWPDLVDRLVLIGATAGLVDDDDRAARWAADERLARRLLSQPLEDVIDQWLDGPLFSGLSPRAAARNARLSNRPEGLAASLRRCGTGAQEPLWARLPELTMPVLLVAGSHDTKFRMLAEEMAAAMSAAQVEQRIIDGNHAVHLERPAETAHAVVDWIERSVGAGGRPTR